MGNVERHLRKYNIAGIVLGLALCLFGVITGIFLYARSEEISELRLDMKETVFRVENGDMKALDGYRALLTDIDGNVMYSSIPLYRMGEKINLHIFSSGGEEEQNISRYVTPVVREGIQTGMLYIENDKTGTWISPMLLIPVSCFLALLLVLFFRWRFVHNDIVIPIVNLNRMAEEISKGNYKLSYTYDISNEIGFLCRKIELLRDELDLSMENERKLRENEKMLLACISHDLKTPLATISGFAEGIRDGIAGGKAGVESYAEVILKKTALLNKLINDIIENTAAEVGSMKLNMKEVFADKYIEETLNSLMPDIRNSGLTLSCGMIPEVLIIIDTDRTYQVFLNIIGNAIKYTQKGGTVIVNCEQRKHDIAVTIRDNGQGIAAADVPYVFNRFFRGERARTQDIGGSGLGLSIVKNIIELQGGTVECESEAGEGTAISFTLPLA